MSFIPIVLKRISVEKMESVLTLSRMETFPSRNAGSHNCETLYKAISSLKIEE